MLDPKTGNVIVFNGEIYNFRALRAGLEKRGESFRTTGDTEVLLALYRIHGQECLKLLRGMFAFALWDPPPGRSSFSPATRSARSRLSIARARRAPLRLGDPRPARPPGLPGTTGPRGPGPLP